MTSKKTLDIVEFLFCENLIGLRNGDSIDRIIEVLGPPEAFSSPGRDPVLLKYGNVQITCVTGKLAGIGIDLSEDSPPEPENIDLAEVMQLRGLSRQEVAEFFRKRRVELVDIDEKLSRIKGVECAFLSFEDGAIYRLGLGMRI